MQSQKWQNVLCSFPRQAIQYHSNPSLCPNHQCWRSWWPTRLSRTNTKKKVLFIIGDWNAKVGSQETPGVQEIWPWSTEWSRAKANRVLPREHTGHSKHPLLTTQERTLHMDITRWSTLKSDWLYSLQPKWRSYIQSAKTRSGADCGSDHELLIAKFRLKLKKVGKTTRPFR